MRDKGREKGRGISWGAVLCSGALLGMRLCGVCVRSGQAAVTDGRSSTQQVSMRHG